MNMKSTDELLLEVCKGREELFALGQKFNQETNKHIKDVGESEMNNTVEAIFELEGISLSTSEKQLVRKLDQLKWGDDQVIEFLKRMGSSK
jgi:hypothetical protein